MGRLKSTLDRIEKRLNVNEGPVTPILSYLFDYTVGHDFVKAEYFKDVNEQQKYVDWRIEQLNAEHAKASTPYPIYALTLADIQGHIEEFRLSLKADAGKVPTSML